MEARFDVKYEFHGDRDEPCWAEVTLSIPTDPQGLPIRPHPAVVGAKFWGCHVTKDGDMTYREETSGGNWLVLDDRVNDLIAEALAGLRAAMERYNEALATAPRDCSVVFEL